MARIKEEKALPVAMQVDEEVLEKAGSALNEVTVGNLSVLESFETIKALGRIETANFFTTVGDKLIAETAINIRESKKFKGLPYKDKDGVLRHVGDFSEFCRVFLGKSYTRTMELIGNYQLLGADLYEKAEQIGFRQRDYNALKALPLDDKKVIADLIQEESFDRALEIIEEMAARNQRQKEAAAAEIEEQRQLLQAKDDVLQKKSIQLTNSMERIAVLELAKREEVSREHLPGHYKLNALHQFAVDLVAQIEASMRSHIVQLYAEFPSGAIPKHVELAVAQSLGLVITAAYGVCEDLYISPQLEADKAGEDPVLQDLKDFESWDGVIAGQEGQEVKTFVDGEFHLPKVGDVLTDAAALNARLARFSDALKD